MDRAAFEYLFLNFEGRISRQPFWVGSIILLVADLVAGVLFGGPNPLYLIVVLALVYPGLAVCVKRCHDRGKSGWWCLLLIVPIVGFLWWLIDLGIIQGEAGDNQYGPDPLAAGGHGP